MTSFKPTLAAKADLDALTFPLYASPKLDGIRATVVGGKLLSRTLKPIPNDYIRSLLENRRFEGFDGELIIGPPTADDVYTQSVSGVMRKAGTPDFTFYVFDGVTETRTPFNARLQALKDMEWPAAERLRLLGQVLINDRTELDLFEAECIDAGYEGVILRSPSAPYKFGRSTVKEGYLLKVKRFEDSEAEVLGVVEEMHNGNAAEINELGRTKRSSAKAGKSGKGTMGTLQVRDIHTGVEFEIGTGFSAAQRAEYFDAPPKFVKYKFFPVGVKDKPRHPVFLGVRAAGDMP